MSCLCVESLLRAAMTTEQKPLAKERLLWPTLSLPFASVKPVPPS